MTVGLGSSGSSRFKIEPETLLVLSAGAWYLLCVLFINKPIVAGIVRFDGTTLAKNANMFREQLATVGLQLPTVWLIGLAFARKRSSLRSSLRLLSAQTVALVLLITLVVSLGLNAFELWPFTWRWRESGVHQFATTLVESGQITTIVLWSFSSMLLRPFIEEAVFRFGVLRVLQALSGSSTVAVAGSALAFGVAHLGSPFWRPDTPHLLNAFWLFLASVWLGAVTARCSGNLVASITAHVTRNSLELIALFAAVASSVPH
jgi:hypothetical protein